MSKYTPLWEYIQANGSDAFKLTHAEIEQITGLPIDHSFLTYKKELSEYGYKVAKISLKEQTVAFERMRGGKMRRLDREVKEFSDLIAIVEKCDVCRLALNDDGFPYILPLNFGMNVTDGNQLELYFHGAEEGTKYSLIEADNRASFEMDCGHRLVTEMECGNCTMEYESVIGQGHIEMIADEDKYNALLILMKHYHQEEFPFNKAVMPQTKVFKLVVENMTGKRRMKK